MIALFLGGPWQKHECSLGYTGVSRFRDAEF